jgi:hypothetical protein
VATSMGVFFLAILAVGPMFLGCWRMFVGTVAARPVSDRLHYAAGLAGPRAHWDFNGGDFAVLERLLAAAGALARSGRSAILIRTYYMAVRAMGGLLPALAPWSEREMTVCSRYLAARIDRFLASNATCSRRARSL